MSEDQILDEAYEGGEDGKLYVQRKLAGGWKRFANYIIDVIVYYLVFILIVMAMGGLAPELIDEESPLLTLFGFLIFVLYYWLMEAATGKTVGKLITRTRIVKEDGSKPTSINVLGRSLSRLIPFDAFSYLGSNPGWHDKIPGIYVIEED